MRIGCKFKRKRRVSVIILATVACFIIVLTLSVVCRYIDRKLLQSNEETAKDMAILLANSFVITDDEVTYMKSLSFTEMENDSINYRLMKIANSDEFYSDITNVYVLALLDESEIKYTTDDELADFFGYEAETKLNGIWLLNGRYDDKGEFVVTERDDVYRYTLIDNETKEMMEQHTAYGEYTSDAWGTFITGYAPLYTQEGTYVGLLGVDMALDHYQSIAQTVILVLMMTISIFIICIIALFVRYYLKYTKAAKDEIYSDFYSRMSHDMRTPMNGILGIAELSKKEESVEVLHHNFEEINEAGTYMLNLINDTLDLSRIESDKIQINPQIIGCNTFVHNLLQMMKYSADKKQIEIKFENKNIDLDSYSYIDEVRTKQVFVNIMSNAIKFTPEGGSICFSIECIGKSGLTSHDKFKISDTGVGMSHDFMRNHLFRPFEQESNQMSSIYTGTGLGMSITKRLIECMNGKIEVESELGKGTTFTVYLDIEKVDHETVERMKQAEEITEVDVENSLEGCKILLCEDHPLNAEIAIKLLENTGCRVTLAKNGEEGVKVYQDSDCNYFDAILMDIRMPVMDGVAAAKAIRKLAREDGKTVPIIAMSANAYEDDRKKSIEAGMNAYLTKPVNPPKLYQTITECLIKK